MLGNFSVVCIFLTKSLLENMHPNHIDLSKKIKGAFNNANDSIFIHYLFEPCKKNITGLMVINMLKMQYSKQL